MPRLMGGSSILLSTRRRVGERLALRRLPAARRSARVGGRRRVLLKHARRLAASRFPGKFGTFAQNGRKCRDFRDLSHFREFLLWNQERGKKCTQVPTTGVQTPGRPLAPSPLAGHHRIGTGSSRISVSPGIPKRGLSWRFPCATGVWRSGRSAAAGCARGCAPPLYVARSHKTAVVRRHSARKARFDARDRIPSVIGHLSS